MHSLESKLKNDKYHYFENVKIRESFEIEFFDDYFSNRNRRCIESHDV